MYSDRGERSKLFITLKQGRSIGQTVEKLLTPDYIRTQFFSVQKGENTNISAELPN